MKTKKTPFSICGVYVKIDLFNQYSTIDGKIKSDTKKGIIKAIKENYSL